MAAPGLRGQRADAAEQPAQQPALGFGGRRAGKEGLQRAAASRVGARAAQRLRRQRRQRLCKLA